MLHNCAVVKQSQMAYYHELHVCDWSAQQPFLRLGVEVGLRRGKDHSHDPPLTKMHWPKILCCLQDWHWVEQK